MKVSLESDLDIFQCIASLVCTYLYSSTYSIGNICTCYNGLKWGCWPMKKTKIFVTAQLKWASANSLVDDSGYEADCIVLLACTWIIGLHGVGNPIIIYLSTPALLAVENFLLPLLSAILHPSLTFRQCFLFVLNIVFTRYLSLNS